MTEIPADLHAAHPETLNTSVTTRSRAAGFLDFFAKYGMLIAILILIAVFSQTSKAFFSVDNFLLITRRVHPDHRRDWRHPIGIGWRF